MKARLNCLLLAATLALAPTGGRAASLCGTHYKDRSSLEHVLRAQGGRFSAGKAIRSVFVSSPAGLSLWWITTNASHAYPAITCVQKRRSDSGLKQHEAEVDCRGASLAACQKLRRDIAKAKF
jgi:hypothetical protein